MAFFLPYVTKISDKNLIIYPEHGIDQIFDRKVTGTLEDYLTHLYQDNLNVLKDGNYHIVILWNNGKDKMADIWIYKNIKEWRDNPLVDVKNFRNLNLEVSDGITAGDGLIVLGKEEELRQTTNSLDEYLTKRPPYTSDSFYI